MSINEKLMTTPHVMKAWINRFDADGKVTERIDISVDDVASVPMQPEKYSRDDVYNLVVEDENGDRFRPYRFCDPYAEVEVEVDDNGNTIVRL